MRIILVLLIFLPLIFTQDAGDATSLVIPTDVPTEYYGSTSTNATDAGAQQNQTDAAAPVTTEESQVVVAEEEATTTPPMEEAQGPTTTPETDQSPQIPAEEAIIPQEEATVVTEETQATAPVVTEEAVVAEEAAVTPVVEEATVTPVVEEAPAEPVVEEEPVVAEEPVEAEPVEATPEEAEPAQPSQVTPISDAEPAQEPTEEPKQRVRVWNRQPKSEDGSSRYGGLVIPNVRPDSVLDTSTDKICGGTSRGKAGFVTSQNFGSQFKWYIETASPDATCQFRITDNLDQNKDSAYVNLVPKNRQDVNADGSFPCGRATGTETATFNIPASVDGDGCVLEWIWKSGDITIRQCADIAVVSEESLACLGKCQNGGICQRGQCVCPTGYDGQYCDSGFGMVTYVFKKILLVIFFILVVMVLILLVIMLLYCLAQRKIKKGEQEQIYHTNRKYIEFDKDAEQNQTAANTGAAANAQNLRRGDTDA